MRKCGPPEVIKTNPWKEVANLPRSVWLISVAAFVNRLGMMALPFLVLYLTTIFHYSPKKAGIIMSCYGAAALVASPFSGWLSDRIGAVRVSAISLLSAGVVLLLYPLAQNFSSLIFATIAWAAGGELLRPASHTAIGQLATAEQRKPGFALYRLALNLGSSVGPAAGGFIAAVSFRALFWIDGVTSILAGMILFALIHRLPNSAQVTESDRVQPSKSPNIFWNRNLILVLMGTFFISALYHQIEVTAPLFLVSDLRLPISTVGILLFLINTLLVVALEIPINVWTRRWSHRFTSIVGTILLSFGIGSLALATGKTGVVISVVIWTFGEMITFTTLTTYVSEISPKGATGKYMGLFSMMMGLAAFVAPSLGTSIYQQWGPTTLWVAACSWGLLATFLFAGINRKRGEATS